MSRTKAALVVAAGAVIGLVGCSGSSGGNNNPTPTTPPATQPAAQPSMTITPNSNLASGQKVTVVGQNYTPGGQYQVTECADKGAQTGADDCDLTNFGIGKAKADGSVTIKFTVKAKGFGGNKVNCLKSPGCILSLANAGTAAPTEVATEKLHFAKK